MKNCSQCGAPMKDDEVVCPVCGQEVQLVPNYETMESRIYEQQKKREKEAEELRQEEEKQRQEQEERRARRKKRGILFGLLALAAAIVVICVVLFTSGGRGGSFEVQMQKAETAYSNSNYQEAMNYVEAALAQDPDSAEALTLRAQIYDKLGDPEKAAEELEKVIADNPNYEAAYSILIRVYNDLGAPDKIRELMDTCRNAEIKEKYSSYVCADPAFSLEPGSYDEEKSLQITFEGSGEIYYTTDGSDPTESSTRYTKALKLEEGKNLIRAIAVNDMGIRSNIAEAEYTIKHPVPSRPVIRPASGSYNGTNVTKITVTAEEGCTIYYSFDTRPTTSSTRYTGPVNMLDGTHTFYAIAVSEARKISGASSAVYVVDRSANASTVATPTPEPTEEPEETPSSGQTSTTPEPEEPTPEPTMEPTPEDTPEPTPEDTPEPTEEPAAEPTAEPTPELTAEPVEFVRKEELIIN